MFNVLRFKKENVWNVHENDFLLPEKRSYSVWLTYSMEQSPSWEANWFCS